MKTRFVGSVVAMLLLCLSISAQEVSPTNVNFGDVVVGQTSRQVNVTFTNRGNSDLELTITISGPFAIPVNHCGRGVKVGTHCNVDVTYTPNAEETDAGTLLFNYGQGTVDVPLTGTGVATLTYPTKNKLKGPKDVGISEAGTYVSFYDTVTSKGGTIPDGELVYFTCENSKGGGFRKVPAPVEASVAFLYIYIDQFGTYSCTANYPGDSQFDPSVSNTWNFYSYYGD